MNVSKKHPAVCISVVSNISFPMLLVADDESLTDAGVLTVLNAGVVAVDLRSSKICALFSLERNLVFNQVLPQIKSIPAAGLALHVTNIAVSVICITLKKWSHIFERFLLSCLLY
ncbi:hypothetical protein ILYODFUR_029532 [Ilyodon furcidens]|uniref:Uncharacterized protein n=1 Tax=Ilyodon furcidens TaxID=33524 RepID=A0ABV0V941_9TELE